jgi:thymidylate synthase (FAD)
MKVYVIGKTQADLFPYMGDSRRVMPGKADGSAFEARHKGMVKGFPDTASEGEALIEFAGRLCYESFDMPNPKTATRAGYIANILMQNHESVLEHVSVTFYVEGVSRNLSHELIRHRHLSFSELSQRYVNMEDANYIVPPAWREELEVDKMPLSECKTNYAARYEWNVEIMKSKGLTNKQAREAARYSLPAGTETKFVVTGNLRAWRDVLKKRDSTFADAEMQLFAKEVKRQLGELYPNALGDLHEGGSD